MPKIEIYNDSRLPQGGFQSANATGADFGAATGVALQNLSRSFERTALIMKDAEDNQETLAASGTLNSLQREAQDELRNREVNANPQSPEFRKNFVSDYDQWFQEKSSEILAGTDNSAARNYLTQHLDSLRTSMYGQAAQSAAAMYGEATKAAYKTSQSEANDILAQNPDNANFDLVANRQRSGLQSLKIDPVQKLRLEEETLNDMGVAQVTAAITKNAAAFVKATTPGQSGVTLAPPAETSKLVGAGQPTLAAPVEGANPGVVPPPIYDGPTDPGMEISRAGAAVIDPVSQEQTVRANLSKLAGWKHLSEPQKQHAVGMVLNQVNKASSSEGAELEREIKDRMAMMADGRVPDDLSSPRFSRANMIRLYGPDVGARAADAWDYQVKVGQALNVVGTMTPEQIKATATTLEPKSADGYYEASKTYAAFTAAAAKVDAFRQKNPMDWALQNKVNNVAPINFDDYDQMGAELGRRGAAAVNMAKNYGTKPQILTEGETDAFVQRLNVMAPIDKIRTLQRMRQSFGTDTQGTALYRTLMDQVSPKSPMAAMAGNLAIKSGPVKINGVDTNPVTVAQFLLEGEYILRGSKMDDPNQTSRPSEFQESQLKATFNNVMGNAFRNLNAVSGARAQTELYQAVKNYLAADMYHRGIDLKEGAMDRTNVERAVNAVSGGLWKRNGDTLMAPWGYPMDKFQNEFNPRAKAAIKEAGLEGSYYDALDVYSFDNVSDGKYVFRNGSGYLLGKNGMPVVIDYSKPAPVEAVKLREIQDAPGLPSEFPEVRF